MEIMEITPRLTQLYYRVESNDIPYILVNGRLIRFTNVLFTEKGGESEIYLVVNPDGEYMFLEVGYESDSDGSFHWSKFLDKTISLRDYNVNSEVRWDAIDLFHMLNRLK